MGGEEFAIDKARRVAPNGIYPGRSSQKCERLDMHYCSSMPVRAQQRRLIFWNSSIESMLGNGIGLLVGLSVGSRAADEQRPP